MGHEVSLTIWEWSQGMVKNGNLFISISGIVIIAVSMSACVEYDGTDAPDVELGEGPGVGQSADKKLATPGLILTEPGPALAKPSVEQIMDKLAGTPLVWESNIGPGLNQYDDDCDAVPLGFTFQFYGASYDHVWINSNGNMTFSGCNTAWWHPDIPDGGNSIIGPLYGDFNPSSGGDVHAHTLGSAPDRRFVVTWENVPEYSGGGANTFQVQLFEGSNQILFGYNGLRTDGINWAYMFPSTNGNMDVGISSGTGSYINSASGVAIRALDYSNICYMPVAGGYTELRGQCVIDVDIDIKPGGEPNSINCHNDNGVIAVAILSTDDFDAMSVDHTTVVFAGAVETHVDQNGDARRHEEDVDGDGDTDLVLHFRKGDTDLTCASVEGELTGETFDGQPIKGADSVRMVPDKGHGA